MSIKIDNDKCIGCGKCLKICPGSLIYKTPMGKAFIKYPRDCWGCTGCLKECSSEAIKYYLGLDIGGRGSILTIKEEKDMLSWHIKGADNKSKIIKINRRESNKY